MTIAKRLMVLLAVPLVALLGLGVFTRLQLSKIEERGKFVADSQSPRLALPGTLSRTFAELRVNVRSDLLATNQEERTKPRAAFNAGEAEVGRLLSRYADTLVSDARDRRLLNDYGELSRDWVKGAREVMSLAEGGRVAEGAALLNGSMAELGGGLSKVSSEWIEHNEVLAVTAGR